MANDGGFGSLSPSLPNRLLGLVEMLHSTDQERFDVNGLEIRMVAGSSWATVDLNGYVVTVGSAAGLGFGGAATACLLHS
jgi:hypothetical protein